VHHEESSSNYSTASRHDHRGNGTAGALSSSSPQGLLGLVDLPPSTAAAAAIASALPRDRRYQAGRPHSPSAVAAVENVSSRTISDRAGRSHHGFSPPNMPPPVLPDAERRSNPRGLNPPAHHLHHHHPQQRHFNAASGAAGRQLDGGGLYGDDDNFDFLRTILLDAGDGSAHAAHQHHHHHHNNSALPSLGGAGAGYVPISTFAPISAAKSPSYAATVTTAPQALHPVLSSSSMAAATAGGRRFPAPAFGGSYSSGAATAVGSGSGSGSGSGGVLGATGVAGYPHTGGGARGSFHATEAEKLQAADDIARCIWRAGDEIREVLLTRLWEVWGTSEADMVSMAAAASGTTAGTAANAIAAGIPCGGGSSPPSSSPKKSFNEVLMERLQATREEVEVELEAAKGRGDAAAFCNPPQQHWRGGADLRNDILSRLEVFQRNTEEDTRGMPGFSSIMRSDDLDRQRQRAVSAAVSAAAAVAAAAAPTRGTGTGVRRAAPPPSGGGGRSRGDLKQASDRALDGTDRVVKSELMMYGDSEVTTCGVGTNAENPPTVAGGRGGGGGRGRRTTAAEAPGSSPAAAGGTAKRKRKRSGNGRRCKHEGCSLHPHFGLTRPEYCSKHKLPGMFNVKGRRCVHPECTRTPVYGKPGDPHPTYCAAHKLAGYVDIKNPTCREPTCFRQPSFGSATDRKATYCASHMLSGHVNVRRMLASFKA
ncbi:unnamed protein product, partial [Hapterophycus canaliculatus]